MNMTITTARKIEAYKDHLMLIGIQRLPLAGSFWEIEIENTDETVSDSSYSVALEKAHNIIDNLNR